MDTRSQTLTKEAGKLDLLKGLHNMVRHGVWKTVAKNTAETSLPGRVSRLFFNPAAGEAGKSTLLAKGLAGYGFAGMAEPLTGVDLPGSDLAFNTTMPVLGALFAAPGMITTGRMMSRENQNKLKEDAMSGARTAAGDLITLTQMDPRFATEKGRYSQYLRQYQPELMDMADNYRTGSYKAPTGWHTARMAVNDPQSLINNRVDRHMFDYLRGGMTKSQSLRKQANAFTKGFGHVFPWLFPTAAVGMIGHAALADKPYDVEQATARGYAGAQVKLQEELDKMNTLQRFGVSMDPSLLARKLDEKLPGTLNQWQQSTGQAFRPGWIARIADRWNKGGETKFYEYDAAGRRHYI